MTTFSIDFQTLCYEIISEQFRFLTYFKNVAYFTNVTLHIWDSLRNVLNFFSFFFVSYLHAWAKFYDAAAAARLCPRPSFGVSRHAVTFDEIKLQKEHQGLQGCSQTSSKVWEDFNVHKAFVQAICTGYYDKYELKLGQWTYTTPRHIQIRIKLPSLSLPVLIQ